MNDVRIRRTTRNSINDSPRLCLFIYRTRKGFQWRAIRLFSFPLFPRFSYTATRTESSVLIRDVKVVQISFALTLMLWVNVWPWTITRQKDRIELWSGASNAQRVEWRFAEGSCFHLWTISWRLAINQARKWIILLTFEFLTMKIENFT